MAGLRHLLAGEPRTRRLVTLTGTGGTGKTRVALRIAADLATAFDGGVFFVALAAIADPALVVPTISRALGLPDAGDRVPLERLIDHLRDRRALLVLDNFEQILEAAGVVADLMAGCPDLSVLVTSRAPLGLSGEHEYLIPPLTLPEHGRAAPRGAEVAGTEAVRLFVERAQAIRADFALTDETAPAVVELCRRLDGLPLAIELAAVHVRLMDPPAMLARLQSVAGSLDLLTGGRRDLPPRQRTLRDTIRWSHDLLDPTEQVLFRRLAVFAGGCTLAAAEEVCADPAPDAALGRPVVLPTIESLLAKSLIQATTGEVNAPRVTMLETVREFARERLAEAGESDVLRQRHGAYVLGLAEQAEVGLRGPDEVIWLDRLQADLDNLRVALEWGLATDAALALRLGAALDWFWWMRGQSEGRGWLTRALAASEDRSLWRMKGLHAAGQLAHYQHDATAARRYLEESLGIARERGDRATEAWVLHLLGRVAYFAGESATARDLAQQSLAIGRELDDDWLVGWAIHLLGLAAHIAAGYEAARSYYEQSLVIRRRLGQPSAIATVWILLGMVSFREGKLAEARERFADSLRLVRDLGSHFHLSVSLADVAGLAAAGGQLEAAVRLAAASVGVSEEQQVQRIPLSADIAAEALAIARRELDPAAYETAWRQGQSMATAEAVADALAVLTVPPTPDEGSGVGQSERPAGLTASELRVLRLLASGRTTQQIADDLVVAISTVERHITHIYGKIGVRGRAAATAFALREGLLSDRPAG